VPVQLPVHPEQVPVQSPIQLVHKPTQELLQPELLASPLG